MTAVDLGNKSGAITLTRDQRVAIDKTSAITAAVSWETGADYDVYGVILYKDGTEKVCSTFGSQFQPVPTPTVGGVRHNGDITVGVDAGRKGESLTIALSKDIDKIAVVVYSAQSNDQGSFSRYNVSVSVDNGVGDRVTIPAAQDADNERIYTCVPAVIANADDGAVIECVEVFSAPGSEARPTFTSDQKIVKKGLFKKAVIVGDGALVMDKGSINIFK